MPIFDDGERVIHYEDAGSGFPVLLIAPGGMKSSIAVWDAMPWNPVTGLADRYRVVAMDQRNAGQSSAPITADDGWATYTADQLALMDHLGIDKFHVMGMCIGGPYGFGLIEAAPNRVASATLFQPIGLDDNRQAFYDMFDGWAEELKAAGRDLSDDELASFRSNMYDGDAFLFNVDDDFVRACATPLLVLEGNDLYHPQSTSQRIRALAPNLTYVEHWKDSDSLPEALKVIDGFLAGNTPAVEE